MNGIEETQMYNTAKYVCYAGKDDTLLRMLYRV